MNGVFDAVFRLGRQMLLTPPDSKAPQRIFTGLIQPSDAGSDSGFREPTPPGLADRRRFTLFAPPDAFDANEQGLAVGSTVSTDGVSYRILRAEPFYLSAELTHWECVMRTIPNQTPTQDSNEGGDDD